MNSNWEIRTLGEVCEFRRGLTYSKSDEVSLSKNAVLRANNIDLYSNSLNLVDIRYISESVVIPQNKKLVKNSVMICTASGSKSHLGKVAFIDKDYDFAFGGFMGLLVPNIKIIDPLYFFTILTSAFFREHVDQLTVGANINNLKFSQIESFQVTLPPLEEQKRIVKILDEKFGAIEELRKVTEQQIADAKELFKSRLAEVYSSPHYNFGNLGDSVQIKTGKLNSNAAVDGGQYPFFTCSREASQIDSYSFDCDAVLLAGNNASADFNVKHYRGKFDAYQRTYVITVLDENLLDIRFVYNLLTHGLAKLKESAVGAGTKFLKIGMIETFQLPQLSLREQKKIVNELDDLSDKTKELEAIFRKKITDLEELKKSYLEQAFSGNL